jgi:hypothetical protein
MNKELDKQIESSLVIVKENVLTIEELKNLKITSQATLESSAEGLKRISKVSKIIKEEKDKNIKPLRQVIANINDFWKPFEISIYETETNLKVEQGKWKKKVDEAEAKEKARLAEQFQSGNASMEEIEKSGEKLQKLEEKKSIIKTFTYKGVRILDKKLIPLEFMEPNESLIKMTIESGIPVPGAEIFTEERVKK